MNFLFALNGTNIGAKSVLNIAFYMWRLVATGFCFTMFGIGGLFLSLIVFPVQILIVHNPRKQKKMARKTVHYAFKLFVSLMVLTGVLRLNTVKAKQLTQIQGHLVLSNHPSLIDVVVLLSIIENADCVVKAHLFKNPFVRGVVKRTGYISNESPAGLIEDCEASLAEGNNLIIFPEGTRTTPGQEVKFQRGAANIAVRCQAKVATVFIKVEPTTLTKLDSWYNIPEKKVVFSAEVLDNSPGIPEYNPNTINRQVRQYSQALESYFNKELCFNE